MIFKITLCNFFRDHIDALNARFASYQVFVYKYKSKVYELNEWMDIRKVEWLIFFGFRPSMAYLYIWQSQDCSFRLLVVGVYGS